MACCQEPYWRKLDTGLSMAFHDLQDLENVHVITMAIDIPTPLTKRRVRYLQSLGVYSAKSGLIGENILTGHVAAGDINRLSHRPWVRYLKLSRKMHPLTPTYT